MLDIVMLVIGLGFFALSVGYAQFCDRLTPVSRKCLAASGQRHAQTDL